MKIKIILGSTRKNRFGEHPARYVYERLKQREGIDCEIVDLRDYPMPFFEEPISPKYFKEWPNEAVAKFAAKIKEADGFIIVSPEYNHGYSAVLKNALDYVYYEWENKPIAFVGYGSAGGARAVEQLRQVVIELQALPTRNALHIMNPWELTNENGELKDGALNGLEGPTDAMFDQLINIAQKMSK